MEIAFFWFIFSPGHEHFWLHRYNVDIYDEDEYSYFGVVFGARIGRNCFTISPLNRNMNIQSAI